MRRYRYEGHTFISTVRHFCSPLPLTSWVTLEKLSFTFFLSSSNDHIISPVHYLRFVMINILMIKMMRTWGFYPVVSCAGLCTFFSCSIALAVFISYLQSDD